MVVMPSAFRAIERNDLKGSRLGILDHPHANPGKESGQLVELFPLPFIGGMVGNGRMHHLSSFVFHKDEHIERFEEDVVDDCEITSPNFTCVIFQKCSSILTCFLTHLLHVFTNCMFMQLDAQLLGHP